MSDTLEEPMGLVMVTLAAASNGKLAYGIAGLVFAILAAVAYVKKWGCVAIAFCLALSVISFMSVTGA